MKIQGTCNHQDHAGVGAALPDRLQAYRIGVLKAMGCNSVRTSHNMPTPEWVAACDRLGMTMMCETRQMSSNPESLAQLEVMVKRYRNSPSIILWSIGNEEFTLQSEMSEQGAKIAASMVRRCHELDPTRVVSAAVNGNNEKGISDSFDIIGFNYNLKMPDGYHQKNPKMAVYGSETSSAIGTRGDYATDKLSNTINSYDGVVPWGETAEEWWTFYGTREWEAGGYAWTGFDYRGEPTPYGWPSINSQFGIVDMCGFPKDNYFYYKAWWGKEPSLHVFPHWNFEGREGEEISVWVYSNLDEVELFLNGASLGSQKVPHLGHVQWKVKYHPGAIEARGSKDGKVVLTEKRETAGPTVAIRLTADRTQIDADGEDLVFLKVEALDKEGRAVPTADNFISFKIAGEGAFIGVGNGDPNCQESDKEPKRSLFNGLAQVIVQSTRRPGEIRIEAVKEGWDGPELTPAKLVITTRRGGVEIVGSCLPRARMAAQSEGIISSMSKKIRWGVLSTAAIGVRKVLPAMQLGKYSEVAAIASRDLGKARDAASKLGIPTAYGSYEELLEDPNVDAIYNPLPNQLHVPWTIKAAEAGKHVLCEKPISLTVAEAESLLKVRERTSVKIGEAFMIRSHPQWLRTKALIDEGRIGQLRCVMGCFSYHNVDPKNIRNNTESGGGALYDIGCYCIQAARYAFGAEPRRVVGCIDHDPEDADRSAHLGDDGIPRRPVDLYLQHAVRALPARAVLRHHRTHRDRDSVQCAEGSAHAHLRRWRRALWRRSGDGGVSGVRSVHDSGRRVFKGDSRRHGGPRARRGRHSQYGGDRGDLSFREQRIMGRSQLAPSQRARGQSRNQCWIE